MTTETPPMTPFDEWRAEERQRRLERFYEKRPAAFAAKGSLDPRVHAWLEGFVAGDARTLLLGGNTGSGKTWTGWKAIETLIANDWRGGWEVISAYELSRLIAPPVDTEDLDQLARRDLLVIDDLGSMTITDWGSAHLLGLVDHRWQHRLATIVTTNVENLGEIVGDRIASRLSDGVVSIPLNGPDRRRNP